MCPPRREMTVSLLQPNQVFQDHTAEQRLLEFGLTVSILSDALDRAAAMAADTTEFDSKSHWGNVMYSKTMRFLRESLSLQDWDGGQPENQMRLWSRKYNILIIHSLGDELVGDPNPDAIPSPKHPKGPATARVIEGSKPQEPEFGLFELIELPEVKEAEADLPVWILLYRVEDERIVAELSRPALFANGRVVSWAERIVLPDIIRGGEIALDDPFDLPTEGVDVEIRRRA